MAKSMKGFTFIELLVVVIVLAALTGLAVTQFRDSYESRSSTLIVKELTSYLRYLQFYAVEKNEVYKLEVNERTETLRAWSQESGSQAFREARTPFRKRFGDLAPFSLSLGTGKALYFFPDGSVTKNKLYLMRDSKKEATIEIRNRLGAFRVVMHN